MTALIGLGTPQTAYVQPSSSKQVEEAFYPDKKIRDLVPTTRNALTQTRQKQESSFNRQTEQLQAQFTDNAPMARIIQTWNEATSSVQVYGSTLWVTGAKALKDDDQISQDDLDAAKEAMVKTYNEKFQNPGFKAAFADYAQRKLDEDADLKPFEWHYLYRIAQGVRL